MTEPSTPLPADPPTNAGERETLVAFLDSFRAVIRRKAEGLDAAQLDRAIAPSTMTLGGMLSHLAFVEDYWFRYHLAGEEPSEPWRSADWAADGDWDWHRAAGMGPAALLAEFDEAVARSRAILEGMPDLDAAAARPPREGRDPITVRWVLVHMLEELARHAGHADLLRESIDGAVGD